MSDDDTTTPFERFKALAKRVVAVPKAEIAKRESAYKKRRAKRKRRGSGGVKLLSCAWVLWSRLMIASFNASTDTWTPEAAWETKGECEQARTFHERQNPPEIASGHMPSGNPMAKLTTYTCLPDTVKPGQK